MAEGVTDLERKKSDAARASCALGHGPYSCYSRADGGGDALWVCGRGLPFIPPVAIGGLV